MPYIEVWVDERDITEFDDKALMDELARRNLTQTSFLRLDDVKELRDHLIGGRAGYALAMVEAALRPTSKHFEAYQRALNRCDAATGRLFWTKG